MPGALKVTVLSHDLSTNAGRRTHRLAGAARTFADVKLIGPASRSHGWVDGLPDQPWIHTVRKRRRPDFHASFAELVEAADGDVLIAVKPHLASFAVALVASELRGVPVILDIDDLDVALAPRSRWPADPAMTDLSRPKSPLFVSVLTRATGAARPIVASAVSDLPDVLDGCGRLVPAGDGAALAAAIGDLLEDRAQARELGDTARGRCVERYSFERVGEQLTGIAGSVARTPAPRPLAVGIGA
jgi:glycosyltransferase involved in cell wall biosynthesis